VSENRGSVVGGAVLIMLGLAFLGMQVFEAAGGAFVPLGLGIAFLVTHAIYRNYGFLVPGGILAGLGAGLIAQDVFSLSGNPVVLGLGLGFLSIFLLDRITRTGPAEGYWWPLIPGGILILVGTASMFPDLTDTILSFGWPLALIVLGVVVIVRGVRKSGE